MSGVGYRVRAQLRGGRAATAVLVVLVAVAGGVVLTTVAAARRTDSAFDRMVDANAVADALVNPDWGTESQLTVEEVRALPGVTAVGRVDFAGLLPPVGTNDLEALMDLPPPIIPLDGAGDAIERWVVDDGRFPDPARADELFVERWWAEANDVRVGDPIEVRAATAEELGTLYAAADSGASAEDVAALVASMGTPFTFRVVGVGGKEDSVAYDESFEPLPWVATEAYWRRFGEPSAGFWGALVRLDRGTSAEDLRAELSALHPAEPFAVQSLERTRTKADRAVGPQVVALWVFAALAAFVGLLVVGQALARRLAADGDDNLVLDTLGMTRRDRFGAAMIRVAGIGALGALLAVGVAVALSPLSPIGPARLAEPSPGLRIDLPVVAVGLVAVTGSVVLLGLWPAWRSARLARGADSARPSWAGAALARAGAPVPAAIGVRFALEPGPSARPVPARTTLVGAAVAVAVVAAVVTFAASVDHLVTTPGLYGVPYDSIVQFDGEIDQNEGASVGEPAAAALAAEPRVRSWSAMLVSEVLVDGRTMPTVAFEPGARPLAPAIRDGRAPVADDEVALGSNTMRDLGVGVGDTVRLGPDGVEAAVVGTAVLPGIGTYQGADKTGLGEGMLLTPGALRSLGASFDTQVGSIVIDREAGLSDEQLARSVGADLPPGIVPLVLDAPKPSDIRALERLSSTPVLLSVLLVGLLAATVVHALVLAMRRRRHDVAVLQCIGLRPGGVVGTAVWQAVTIGAVAVALGIPAGIVAGRWAWMVLARLLGVIDRPTVPVPSIVLVAGAVIVVAGLAGLAPGWWSTRRRPARILRTE